MRVGSAEVSERRSGQVVELGGCESERAVMVGLMDEERRLRLEGLGIDGASSSSQDSARRVI